LSQPAPAPRGRLCLVTAADIEFNHIVKALRPEALIGRELDTRLCRANLSGRQGQRPIVVLQSEMGAPNFAERLRRHLAIFDYDGVIVIGLAGALAPQLQTSDVIVYQACSKTDGHDKLTNFACDAALVEWLESALTAQRLSVKRVNGTSVKHVITRATDKAALHHVTQATAVDMESGLILEALRASSVPLAALRVVLDEAAHDLPAFDKGLCADGTYDTRQMLRILAARPAMSLQFLWNLRRATRKLRAITRALLKA
jgi:nucleoside phosphorylase